ncbi:MAG: hypothetical protein JXR37_24605 [Kiritimatiellae bacterium]|nr:hypothetical protein [Kiritimatiellia bacterium]
MAKRTEPACVYLFAGDDDLRAGQSARELVARLVPPEQAALGLETVSGTADTIDMAVQALDQTLAGLLTLGFFGSGKVVWLREANFFDPEPLGKHEAVKTAVRRLGDTIKQGLPAGHILVITATKVAKNSVFRKACEAAGEVRDFTRPQAGYQAGENQARERARAVFQGEGLALSGPAMDLFIEKVGTNPRQIENEAAKLATYVGVRKRAGPEDVMEIVCASRESAVWEFTEAIAQKRLAQALRILKRSEFQKDMPPIRLIYNLEYKLRELLIFREALSREWVRREGSRMRANVVWDVPPEAEPLLAALGSKDPRKMNAFRCGKLLEQAARFTEAELARWHGLILAAHEKFVSSSVPQGLLLELLVFRLIAPAQAGSPGV